MRAHFSCPNIGWVVPHVTSSLQCTQLGIFGNSTESVYSQYSTLCGVQSYLNVPNLLSAALSRGAEAIHPGYGFLSENASFVQMCEAHGIAFIGPRPENITNMGDKATARKTMEEAGVPTVPGSPGLVLTEDDAQKVHNKFTLFQGISARFWGSRFLEIIWCSWEWKSRMGPGYCCAGGERHQVPPDDQGHCGWWRARYATRRAPGGLYQAPALSLIHI